MNPDAILDAPLTLILIALTTTISIAGLNSPRIIDALLMDVGLVKRGQFWRLITAGFVHGDYIHLFFNMFALVVFGPALEGVDRAKFLILYLGSILAGSAFDMLDNWRKPAAYRSLGASGGVAGLTVALAIFAPLSMILLFFILPMPIILFAVGFMLWSAYASGRYNDGIGHSAHLGGALGGLVITCLLWPAIVRQLPAQLGLPF